MIYLDHASTTYVYPECIEIVNDILTNHMGNPSNTYRLGREAKMLLLQAKGRIANIINCTPDNILLTSGSSEGNAFVSNQTNKLFTSPFEHHNFDPKLNYKVVIAQDHYFDQLKQETQQPRKEELKHFFEGLYGDNLYTHMYVSNETGEIFPIDKLFEAARAFNMTTACDMTQAAGNVPIDFNECGNFIDYAVFSGHKFHAPKGIGFCYISDKVLSTTRPLIYGTQQNYLRGGTENVAYSVAMSVALEKATKEMQQKNEHTKKLRKIVVDLLQNSGIEYIINEGEENIPSILHFCLKGVESEILQNMLDSYDIFIGVGSGCNDGSMEVSNTLLALKIPEEYIHGPIRLSFSLQNTEEEVIIATQKLIEAYKQIY